VNPVLVTCVVNWGFITVNRCEDASFKRLVLHPTKDEALLDWGSSALDLPVVCLPFVVFGVALC
jgi:hypothetical protein